MLRGKDGFHLWSKTYDRDLKDIFAVQEDIALSVADELKATLGIGKSLKQLGGTNNEEAYELYLVARGQDDNSRALESINAAIDLDPNFALAWTIKALKHLRLSNYFPLDRAAAEQDLALHSILKAIELEPNLAEACMMLGTYRRVKCDWSEAEFAYRKSLELETKPSTFYEEIGPYYEAVGNFQKAYDLYEEARRDDPLNSQVRAHNIFTLSILTDMQQTEEEYQRCKVLFGNEWVMGNFFISTIRLGSGNVVSRDKIPEIPDLNPIHGMARDHMDSPEEGLEELQRLYDTDDGLSLNSLMTISVWAAYFGDPELAMDAIEKYTSIDATRTSNVWGPLMHEVRQLPRFKEFVNKIGLVDYWNKFGWPDICHKLDNGDFECD